MRSKPRYLITSSDECTWRFDRPVVFLGGWCLPYNKRHIWENMDGVVASPYGLGKVQKDIDHTEARGFEDRLFSELCWVLNQHHDIQHSERFWRIVLGHWVRRYVDVMLYRTRS